MIVATFAEETWPIAGKFVISRGAKTEARVITVSLSKDGVTGHGEGVPYPRYNETVAASLQALENMKPRIESGMTRQELASLAIPMSARNALDCALWDLEAKSGNTSVARLAGLPEPKPEITAYTISLGDPEDMAAAASKAEHLPLLKLKLGGSGDAPRIRRVRAVVPRTRLVIDANEAWLPSETAGLLKVCAGEGVELVEQPLPAGQDELLKDIEHPVPICADESAHGSEGLAGLVGKYDAVNIKLDKTGGLTPAIAMARAAQEMNLRIMIGCMVSTSLSMAPALLLAHLADWTDLDGPLILANDRDNGLTYENGVIMPGRVWG
jgi:L-Ala-D/L-Glu epimerase